MKRITIKDLAKHLSLSTSTISRAFVNDQNIPHDTKNLELYKKLIERGTPLIFFDRIPETSLDVPKVIINDHIQAALMVEHLIENGNRKIAHIMGPSSIKNAKERAMGYEKILNKHKIYNSNLMIKTKGMKVEDGRKATEELLAKNPEVDAIFAFSDTLAIGAMNYLLEKGYKIPDDIAIASFSGTELATLVYPPLTSVEQPLVKMGEATAELALEKIENQASENRTIILHSELRYRASTMKKNK